MKPSTLILGAALCFTVLVGLLGLVFLANGGTSCLSLLAPIYVAEDTP